MENLGLCFCGSPIRLINFQYQCFLNAHSVDSFGNKLYVAPLPCGSESIVKERRERVRTTYPFQCLECKENGIGTSKHVRYHESCRLVATRRRALNWYYQNGNGRGKDERLKSSV